MRDIDPQIMRLREVECRVALMEMHLRLQEDSIDDMKRRGWDVELAMQLRESLSRAVELFRKRQTQILEQMQSAGPPAAGSPPRGGADSVQE